MTVGDVKNNKFNFQLNIITTLIFGNQFCPYQELLLHFIVIGQAKQGHVKRECEQRIADAVRLELGAPKVTASRRPALYIQKKRILLLLLLNHSSAFSDFLGIFEGNRPLIIRLGDFRPMPAHEH